MSQLTANIEAFLSVSVVGFALLQFLVGLLSFRRFRNPRILLITLGFLMFSLKGAYLVYAAYLSRGTQAWILPVGLLDLLTLLLLYFSVRNR
jgi:hypothetical protein